MSKKIRKVSTVTVIIVLLAGSASLRVLSNAGAVMAAAQGTVAEVTDKPKVSTPVSTAPNEAELDGMLRAFQQREARIKEQEAYIEERMETLKSADQKIDQKLSELREAEEQLRATLTVASSAAEDDLTRLTAVYESMKPKVAAALFQEMAPEFAAGFLGRMKPDAAASVMAGMTPESAYTVSAILAGRNAKVPKE